MNSEIKVVSLYLYKNGENDYIKLLIDENDILYHYFDHVPMGILDKTTDIVEFYYETQKEYDDAKKNNNIILKRLFD